MKTFSFILMTLALILLSSEKTFACKCPAQPIEQSFAESSAVFYGTVESVSAAEKEVIATFRVEKSWKGADIETVYVSSDKSTCGIDFKVGQTHYLFVNGSGGNYQTVSCRRHGDVQAEFLKNTPMIPLRQTSPPPVPSPVKNSNFWETPILIISAAIGLAVISLLLYFLRTKKR